MPNTNKARRRANILRKRLNRIFLNPLLKKARNNIILQKRKQKKSLALGLKTQRETWHKDRNQKIGHFYKKYTLPESSNTQEGVYISIGDLRLRLYIILISILSALIGIVEVIIRDLYFSCQSDLQYLYYANKKRQERKLRKKRPPPLQKDITEFKSM